MSVLCFSLGRLSDLQLEGIAYAVRLQYVVFCIYVGKMVNSSVNYKNDSVDGWTDRWTYGKINGWMDLLLTQTAVKIPWTSKSTWTFRSCLLVDCQTLKSQMEKPLKSHTVIPTLSGWVVEWIDEWMAG